MTSRKVQNHDVDGKIEYMQFLVISDSLLSLNKLLVNITRMKHLGLIKLCVTRHLKSSNFKKFQDCFKQ